MVIKRDFKTGIFVSQWAPKQEKVAKEMLCKGFKYREIARIIGRTKAAIQSRNRDVWHINWYSWTEEEKRKCINLLKAKKSYSEIAEIIGRTPMAIERMNQDELHIEYKRRHRVKIKCANCQKERIVKPSQAKYRKVKGRFFYPARFCSKKCYRAYLAKGGECSLNRLIRLELQKRNIEFKQEALFVIKKDLKYYADFLLPQRNLIIECDSKFWHSNSKERDKKKDEFLKSKGFKIIRLTEDQILTNPSRCIDNIL